MTSKAAFAILLFASLAGCGGPASDGPQEGPQDGAAIRHFNQTFQLTADVVHLTADFVHDVSANSPCLSPSSSNGNSLVVIPDESDGLLQILNGSATMTWDPVLPGQDLVLRMFADGYGQGSRSAPGQSPRSVELGMHNVTWADFMGIVVIIPEGSVQSYQQVDVTLQFDWVGNDVRVMYSDNCDG